jgi:hypothetical protein
MISPEQFITNIQKQIVKLQEDLAISEQNVKDFECLAQTWKKAYDEETYRLKVKCANLELINESLENELSEARKR